MVRVVKRCLQLFMKLVNGIGGVTGIAMILYSLWMIRVWQIDAQASSFDHHTLTLPWFIYAFLGTGITLCAITCLGHVAADTANAHCLSCYMVVVLALLMLETLVISDVFLNSDWEKDFPEDPSGRFDDFKDFVKSNLDICQWVGFLIILAQVLSILPATVLRTLSYTKKRTNYDSDYDYAPRLPLLNPNVQPLPYVVGEPHFAPKTEAWKVIE